MGASLRSIEFDIKNTVLAHILSLVPVDGRYVATERGFYVSSQLPSMPTDFGYLRRTAEELRYYVISYGNQVVAHYHKETKTLELMPHDESGIMMYIDKTLQRLFEEYIPALKTTRITSLQECCRAVAPARPVVPRVSRSVQLANLIRGVN